MTRTTGRTLALLGLLQARREWTGDELRARLEVSERTLRRDIDDLRGLGYGIEATRGRYGGYRLGPGASVPPLTLSPDEAVAIAVGLRAAALGAVTGLEDGAARALAKLEQSLSATARRQITEVAAAMVPLGATATGVDADVVIAVARAIGESRRLRIDYTSHDGARTTRDVEPHRIVHTTTRWYLVAWVPDRRSWRTLRIDRIARPTVLREAFTRREIPDDQLRTFTSRSISAAPYRHRARLRMHAPAAVVREHFGPTVAEVSPEGDDACVLTTGGRTPEEIALYVGLSGIDFEILDGDEVRDAVAGLADRLRSAARPRS